MMHGVDSSNNRFQGQFEGSNRGFSLIEILVALLIGSVLTAMAIPATRSALASYQLDAALDSVTGAIQGTRYQAIMHGYHIRWISIPQRTRSRWPVNREALPASARLAVRFPFPVRRLRSAQHIGRFTGSRDTSI